MPQINCEFLGEAQEGEDREVTSLNTLQNAQQPAYSSGLPAQSYGSPYGYQSPYGGYPFYQQPQMYQPPMPMYPPPQPQYPNFGGNMNYGYPPVGGAVYQPPASVSQLWRFFKIFFFTHHFTLYRLEVLLENPIMKCPGTSPPDPCPVTLPESWWTLITLTLA